LDYCGKIIFDENKNIGQHRRDGKPEGHLKD
jgi:hypothetical protein